MTDGIFLMRTCFRMFHGRICSSEKAGTHHVFCKLYYHDGTNDSTGYTANDLDHAGTAYI